MTVMNQEANGCTETQKCLTDVLMPPKRPQDILGVQMPPSPHDIWGTYGMGEHTDLQGVWRGI